MDQASMTTDDKQIKEQKQIAQRLGLIKHKIMVLSGKGGVGKSTVASNIALALVAKNKKVGLLDIDVHGPSIPKLLGLEGMRIDVDSEGMKPIQYIEQLKVMSIGFLIPDDDGAVIWRGPLKYSVIKQFIKDVNWGELDYLIVDSPPGTGDEPLSIAQLIGAGAYSVMVTTPQQLAVNDVRKSINFCKKLAINILGVVENMSGFTCPHCGHSVDLFKSGGGREMAEQMNVRFLGAIPIDPQIVISGDSGRFFMTEYKDSEAAAALQKIIEPILELDEN